MQHGLQRRARRVLSPRRYPGLVGRDHERPRVARCADRGPRRPEESTRRAIAREANDASTQRFGESVEACAGRVASPARAAHEGALRGAVRLDLRREDKRDVDAVRVPNKRAVSGVEFELFEEGERQRDKR